MEEDIHMVRNRREGDRNDDLLAVALALERMALEIRQEVAHEMGEAEEMPQPDDVPVAVPVQMVPPPAGAVRGGQRVRVTVGDKYYGRFGTLIDRRDRMYWNILMDAIDGGVAHVIYKKESSFAVVIDN